MDFSVVKKTPEKKMMIDGGKQLSQDFENHIYKSANRELIKETDCKGNNNFSNSFKTENNLINSHNASSLFQDETNGDERKSPCDTANCGYGNCKKAIDLTLHNRSCNGETRTIFDDADYFSKNYSYKLLPINFQSVNETLIHSEHNYCHLSQSSGSEAEEDCSRMMDYNQVKEKNYKKRKAKLIEETHLGMSDNEKKSEENLNESLSLDKTIGHVEEGNNSNSNVADSENSLCIQPLDLSAPVSVQDDETDNGPEENAVDKVIENGPMTADDDEDIVADVVEEDEKEDSVQFDSDKENQKSNKNLIEVTITRGDGKNKYEPCDSFLSDIARLVPKIAEKDCSGIDILDRTCGRYMNFEKHRLYYVISESTWRLFQNANERVILTNDRSLGQPVQRMENEGRPTFLIFDQFSLAKCLADYCKEKGGCFEYKFVEEEKEKVTESPQALHGTDTRKEVNGPPEEENSGSVPSNQCQIIDVNENFESETSQIQKCSGNTSVFVEPTEEKPFKDRSGELKIEENDIKDAEDKVVLSDTNVPVEREEEKHEVVEKKEPAQDIIQQNSNSNEVKSDLVIEKIKKEEKETRHSLANKRNAIYSCTKSGSTVAVDTRSSAERAESGKRKQVSTPKRGESNRKRAIDRRKGSSDSGRLPTAEKLGSRKRTSSIKSEETNEKKLKIEEKSANSVRTRSKSMSEAEAEKKKTVSTVTSQKSDSNSRNNSRRVSKRSQASPEIVQKLSNEKGETGKEKKRESSVPVLMEKRRTRSEAENIQVVGNNNNNINNNNNNNNSNNESKNSSSSSSSSGNSNSRRRTLRNSVTKDEVKKEATPNTRSVKKKIPEKQEKPKEPVKERWSLRSQTGVHSATTAGTNSSGALSSAPPKTGSDSSKKKPENPMKRGGTKEDQPKVLPKRRRR